MNRDAWLAALRGEDTAAAVAAATALGVRRDRTAVGSLANALRSVDPDVRRAVCAALGEIADPRAVGPLVSLLRDRDEDVRGEAFAALLAIGHARAGELPLDAFSGEDLLSPSEALTQVVWPTDLEAIAILAAALEDPDPEVRIGAAYTLGRLGITAAFDAMAARLSGDPDPDVRTAAAFAVADLGARGERRAGAVLRAAWDAVGDNDELAVQVVRGLADLGGREAYDPLTEALRHRDERVRQLAAMGLGRLGDPAAVPRLSRLLTDAHRGVRRLAATALGEIGDPLAMRPLVAAVHGNDAEVRATIGAALARLDPAVVQTHLTECLMTPDAGLREAAAYLMGRLGLTAGLRRALRDPDEHVRKAATLAAGQLASGEFFEALVAALDDAAWQVRVAAAESLRRSGDTRAVEALRPHADDPHRVVRNAVGVALRALSGEESPHE
ncbi:HEAT repeat domain-containing protein [Myxococcota bacterium]|nr:HEAT repeat domain-containing protein [Myxococcota bacterium]